MTYRAKNASILDEDDNQIAVVLAVNCSKKAAREMAAILAQNMNQARLDQERRAAVKANEGE